jgi:anti-sigma factor RsiW
MNKIQETNLCGRAEQLVGYLYGESSEAERAGFEQHLAACGACREELSAFRQVRESVGAWRAEVLTHAPALTATEVIPADAPTRAPRNATSTRTAWDALREFFALTPAWLRAATVSAALVVCALAALAIANAEVGRENGNLVFRTGVWHSTPTALQTASAGNVNSGQLDQLIAERDAARRELDETRAQLDDSRAANIQAVYDVMDDSPRRKPRRRHRA